MSERPQSTARQREEAAQWFVRLSDEAASEADSMAFAEWLDAEPGRAEAFDAVEAAWVDVEARPAAAPNVVPLAPRRRPRPAVWVGWSVAGIAAAAVLAIGVTQMIPPPAQTFETTPGQSKLVALADGSKVAMGGGTKLSITYRHGRRDAVLDHGEADFDVFHDPARPFTVAAGDDQIRVLGTEFNVRRNSHTLTVAVSRGAVQVSPADAGAKAVVLPAGQQLRRTDGAADQLAAIAADETAAWRGGNLIYRDRPLAEVAEDLSRYLPTPVTVAPDVANLPVTGVLKLTDEEAVVGRLQTFLEIKATVSAKEIHLERR